MPIDLDRYLHLQRAGTLAAYNDAATGGAQILAIAGAALEAWDAARQSGGPCATCEHLRHYTRHLPGCPWGLGGGLPCDCGLIER